MVWKENRENAYCEITPAILALKEQWEKKNYIDPKLYKEYNVKRGLRDEDGRGVLTGLTRVGEIQSYSVTEGEHIVPQDGMLYYRGIDCRELVKGSEGRRFAFEETAYLLLFGELPTAAQLEAAGLLPDATHQFLPGRDYEGAAPGSDEHHAAGHPDAVLL